MRLAWVTSTLARTRDTDEPLAISALTALGTHVDVVDWDDADVDWASYDRVVVRSAWDYPERLDEFERWLTGVDAVAELINAATVMRWSMDKHYLIELAAAGVAVTPSKFVEVGETFDFDEVGGEFVVKPAVGAGSRDVIRYAATSQERDAATQHIKALHAEQRSVIIQPALKNVARVGEWPMIFLRGAYSHAANRFVSLPGVAGQAGSEFSRPATATPAMRTLAEATISHVHANVGPTTYARVDVVLGDDDIPVVMEVELVEPSLFLPEHPPAAARLARLLADAAE